MLLRLLTLISFVFLFTSCGKDDNIESTDNDFYNNSDTSATEAELLGTWSIFNVEFQDVIVDVPVEYPDCGRDFFVYSENETYTEYLFQSSDCNLFVNTLNWDLSNGIISLSNDFNQGEDLVITELSQNQLVFKAKLDIDEDGTLDIITLHAQRYQPVEIDMVSSTFIRNTSEEYKSLINYTWQPYEGVDEFVKYEIYRSVGSDCSKDTAVLIKTITDASIAEFTDLTPPNEERLCYYLKTITDSGTLGESDLLTLDTYTLEVDPVNLSQPNVVNNTIVFNWEESEMPYFSHYEISYSNFPSNVSGYGEQNIIVAEITDKTATSFIDENPPYLENPIYSIHVYDIFGNKTYDDYDNYTISWEVNYKRNELLDIHRIFSFAIDPSEPIVYFYGYETGESNSIKIHRFNYQTNQTEAISTLSPNTSTDLPIEIISSSNGKELFLEQGGELQVYDANTLDYKYDLNPPGIIGIDDFLYTSSGFWVFTDDDDIYTYTRNNSNLSLVSTSPHFTEHQASYNYSVFEINDNQLLLGHKYEPNSILYSIDTNGFLTNIQTVPVPIMEYGIRKTQYNSIGNFIINFEENRLYSTVDFSYLESFEHPYFPSGISTDGMYIFGSNNDPDWNITSESLHAKEAVIFDRNIQSFQNYTTIGYPHILFQSYNGDIMSISSGLKKEDIGQTFNNKSDLFIESVNVP